MVCKINPLYVPINGPNVTAGSFTVRLNVCCAVLPAASRTLTIKLLVPVPVGVPLSTPVALSFKPVGNLAVRGMDQLYGNVPLMAWSVLLYGVPFNAAGSGLPVRIVNVNGRLTVNPAVAIVLAL